MTCEYMGEPLLSFADGLHVDPKAGIAQYGPRSFRTAAHPRTVKVGLVGTAETMEAAHSWIERSSEGVAGDEGNQRFPGFRPDRGFFSSVEVSDDWSEKLRASELTEVLGIQRQRERFEQALGLVLSKLHSISIRDKLPDIVIFIPPDDFLKRCDVADYRENDRPIHRDFHHAFKAAAMRHSFATQILQLETIDGRDEDQPSRICWNFFTGLYFKGGGYPWWPVGIPAGTCFVGISFYRALGDPSTLQTSLIRAFNERGEGLVLRGPSFNWNPDPNGGRATPHLPEAEAAGVVDLVFHAFKDEKDKPIPRRIVIHKTSVFSPEEKSGFTGALRRAGAEFDLLAVRPQSTVRLFPANAYPVLRSTRFSIGDEDYLYTTGFLASLGEFHAKHVPAPLRISDHVGNDSSRVALLRELLTLTKMNWNSARLGGLLPVTLRFASLVGNILRELPADVKPRPQYRYYM